MEGRRHHVAVGNFEFAWAHEELFADREGCLLRLGEALPARIHLALRTVALRVQALLVRRRFFEAAQFQRPPVSRRPHQFRAD